MNPKAFYKAVLSLELILAAADGSLSLERAKGAYDYTTHAGVSAFNKELDTLIAQGRVVHHHVTDVLELRNI